jgi:OOP family OmpA-OmpF porin
MKKYDYPPTTNATSEIEKLEGDMATAMRAQVNVLSPDHYANARKKLDQAKKENQDRKSNSDVLEDLGYAKANLDAANEVAPRVEAALPEVVKARSDALTAEAVRLRNADLIDADSDLKKVTSDFEKKNPEVSLKKRGELQKAYLDVELASIKINYLDQSKALIEAAKKMGAKKYGATTLASAEAKYQAAERTIETDRHNSSAISQAANVANLEAKRAIEITRMAKGVKDESPEEAAIAMEAKRNEAARNALEADKNATQLNAARDTIRDKNATISDKNEMISDKNSENSKLAADQRFNQAFTTAQNSFTSEEAEVYRQGDKLVVRLKQMQFPTGRSELPGSSMSVLSKVKDVIASMGAESVVVEGHTDAVGSKAKNQVLSQKRADAVAQYFVSENALPSDQITAKGYGDTKPLGSNKSKDGRAQNRRVDVIISAEKPGSTTSGSMTPPDAVKSSASSSTPPAPKRSEE